SQTHDYMQQVLDRVLVRLDHDPPTDDESYFHQLAVFHEDMHTEAFVYTRQTLYYPPPPGTEEEGTSDTDAPWPGDVRIPGGRFLLGSSKEATFVFDNEKWAHPVQLAPFRMARAPVTNAEFAQFVEDRGYQHRELWSPKGWAWREQVTAAAPVYWQRQTDG